MANKVGPLIKKARADAGLTQEQLARKVTGVSASEIGQAERGEILLTQAALKQIAKATGVTQASLINASRESTAKKPTSSTASGKKPSSSSSSPSSSMKVSTAERKLVELYRNASSDAKKAAVKILKGEETTLEGLLGNLLDNVTLFGKK